MDNLRGLTTLVSLTLPRFSANQYLDTRGRSTNHSQKPSRRLGYVPFRFDTLGGFCSTLAYRHWSGYPQHEFTKKLMYNINLIFTSGIDYELDQKFRVSS